MAKKKISRKKKKCIERQQKKKTPISVSEIAACESPAPQNIEKTTGRTEEKTSRPFPGIETQKTGPADVSVVTPQGEKAHSEQVSTSAEGLINNNFIVMGRAFELQTIIALIFLPAFVFAIYSNTYNVVFLFDDEKEIELERALHITDLSFKTLKKTLIGNRPFSKMTFAINYYFDRLNPRYYHLVNILIHITNGIMLYFLLKITLGLPAVTNRRGPPGWIPFTATLLWIVNPAQIQSVTYIVQRQNSMAAMFFMATLLLYINARMLRNQKIQWAMYLGCIPTTIIALGSKENAGTIPLVIFMYEWFFFQNLDMKWLKKRIPYMIGAFIVFLGVGLFYLGADPIAKLQAKYQRTTFTMSQRVMTEWRVVMFYISQLLFPHPSQFNLLHAFSLSSSLFYPITTIFSLLAIIGSLVFATIIAKKERLIAFCIFWFFGNLVIESSIIGLEIIYEHRSYLPSMLFLFLIVLLGNRFIKIKQIKLALYSCLIVISCYWTYSRNAVWADEIAFWQDTINKNPYASRAYNDLANAYAMEGKKKKAVEIYYQGLRLNPNDWKMHYNLGVILESLWETDKAIAQFQWLLRAKQNLPDTHFRLGMIYARKKNFQKAIWHTSEVIRLAPGQYPTAHKNLKAYKKWASDEERKNGKR